MSKEIITEKNINRFVKVMDGEIWKTAVDYPNYLISSYGRCYSLYHQKLLIPILCASEKVTQYYCYKLTKDKKSKWIRVHRLVAKTFIANPDGKREVHHKDGNHFNNRIDNLVWCNHYEHLEYHRKLREEKRAKKSA